MRNLLWNARSSHWQRFWCDLTRPGDGWLGFLIIDAWRHGRRWLGRRVCAGQKLQRCNFAEPVPSLQPPVQWGILLFAAESVRCCERRTKPKVRGSLNLIDPSAAIPVPENQSVTEPARLYIVPSGQHLIQQCVDCQLADCGFDHWTIPMPIARSGRREQRLIDPFRWQPSHPRVRDRGCRFRSAHFAEARCIPREIESTVRDKRLNSHPWSVFRDSSRS